MQHMESLLEYSANISLYLNGNNRANCIMQTFTFSTVLAYFIETFWFCIDICTLLKILIHSVGKNKGWLLSHTFLPVINKVKQNARGCK